MISERRSLFDSVKVEFYMPLSKVLGAPDLRRELVPIPFNHIVMLCGFGVLVISFNQYLYLLHLHQSLLFLLMRLHTSVALREALAIGQCIVD